MILASRSRSSPRSSARAMSAAKRSCRKAIRTAISGWRWKKERNSRFACSRVSRRQPAAETMRQRPTERGEQREMGVGGKGDAQGPGGAVAVAVAEPRAREHEPAAWMAGRHGERLLDMMPGNHKEIGNVCLGGPSRLRQGLGEIGGVHVRLGPRHHPQRCGLCIDGANNAGVAGTHPVLDQINRGHAGKQGERRPDPGNRQRQDHQRPKNDRHRDKHRAGRGQARGGAACAAPFDSQDGLTVGPLPHFSELTPALVPHQPAGSWLDAVSWPP